MPRRARVEKRLLAEQGTVGEQRAERREVEEMSGKRNKSDAALTKAQREARLLAKEMEAKGPAPRIARVGKPLKRP